MGLLVGGAGKWGSMRPPETLSVEEAAKILHRSKGFAGYSLIKDDGVDGSVLGHAIFCPNCGVEIATVNVAFLPPTAPAVGSRLALMTDLAKAAIAADEPKPKNKPRPPEPVQVSQALAEVRRN